MTTIVSAGSGLWSVAATWSPAQVPVVGDKVTISTGHTVTVDSQSAYAGDDTSTGITVLGTLKASRSVSTKLIVRGDLYISVAGTLDYGTEADPIPASITAEIALNDSATQAHVKWGLRTNWTVNAGWNAIRMWGATKTRYCKVTTDVAVNGTVIPVEDTTGWKVGDLVFIEGAAGNPTYYQFRAILAVSSNSITVAALGLSVPSGRYICNLTRNVRVYGVNGSTYRTYVQIAFMNYLPAAGAIELGYVEFNTNGGGTTANHNDFGLGITNTGQTTLYDPIKKMAGVVAHRCWSVVGTTVTMLPTGGTGVFGIFFGQSSRFNIDSISVVCGAAEVPLTLYNGATANFGDVFLHGQSLIQSGYSQGVVDTNINGGVMSGSLSSSYLFGGAGISLKISNVKFRYVGNVLQGLNAIGDLQINDSSFETISNSAGINFYNPGTHSKATFRKCAFPAVGLTYSNLSFRSLTDSSYTDFIDMNNDPTQQVRHMKGGLIQRDNTTLNKSTSSLQLYGWNAAAATKYQTTVSIPANSAIKLAGSVKPSAGFGSTSTAKVTVSVANATDVVFTADPTNSAWQQYVLDVTNPNAYPVDAEITFYVLAPTPSAGVFANFDGIYDGRFIVYSRHYGYVFDPTNPKVTPDSTITLTAAQAAVIPVVIDHTAKTITLNSNVTNAQLYNAAMYDLTLTANLSKTAHIASTDGSVFTTTYTVVLNGYGISGKYTDSAGVHVVITAPNIQIGSRVQLYDLTTGVELYNSVLSSPLAFPIVNNSHTIRLRASYCSGLISKLPIDSQGVLGSDGLSFLTSQSDDPVYEANGIDGSVVTEFIADYPHLQIDVSDSDNITTVQRLYAWAVYNQSTMDGIRYYQSALSASDWFNYVVNVSIANLKLDNVSSTPVVISGGYLSRSDGSSIIAAQSGSIQIDAGKAYVAPIPTPLKLSAGERLVVLSDGRTVAK